MITPEIATKTWKHGQMDRLYGLGIKENPFPRIETKDKFGSLHNIWEYGWLLTNVLQILGKVN
jgi:hypothetical protein